MKALDLRQKVAFASQEVESGLHYDPELVKNMFCHTIMTGLRSDSIKSELRPYLEDLAMTDEMLFEKLNFPSSVEAEPQSKLKKMRPAMVQEVRGEKGKAAPKPGLLTQKIAELRAGIAEMASLKAPIHESLHTTKESENPTPKHHLHLDPPLVGVVRVAIVQDLGPRANTV